MSWAIGYDSRWERDIGYGVTAYCDHPNCKVAINRGLSYVCGGEPYGGEHGCGLYFCPQHLECRTFGRGATAECREVCQRCRRGRKPFPPKPEHPDWIQHVRTHASWATWRAQEPEKLARLVDQFGVVRMVPGHTDAPRPGPKEEG